MIRLPILLQEICNPLLGMYKLLSGHMNVEIGTEATHILFWEYINGIFVAVCSVVQQHLTLNAKIHIS
jgi:hypothetical protein